MIINFKLLLIIHNLSHPLDFWETFSSPSWISGCLTWRSPGSPEPQSKAGLRRALLGAAQPVSQTHLMLPSQKQMGANVYAVFLNGTCFSRSFWRQLQHCYQLFSRSRVAFVLTSAFVVFLLLWDLRHTVNGFFINLKILPNCVVQDKFLKLKLLFAVQNLHPMCTAKIKRWRQWSGFWKMGVQFLLPTPVTWIKGHNLHLHRLLSEEMTVVMLSVLNFVLSVQFADTVSSCKGTGRSSERLQLIR